MSHPCSSDRKIRLFDGIPCNFDIVFSYSVHDGETTNGMIEAGMQLQCSVCALPLHTHSHTKTQKCTHAYSIQLSTHCDRVRSTSVSFSCPCSVSPIYAFSLYIFYTLSDLVEMFKCQFAYKTVLSSDTHTTFFNSTVKTINEYIENTAPYHVVTKKNVQIVLLPLSKGLNGCTFYITWYTTTELSP
jgi:hypothetical protein